MIPGLLYKGDNPFMRALFLVAAVLHVFETRPVVPCMPGCSVSLAIVYLIYVSDLSYGRRKSWFNRRTFLN